MFCPNCGKQISEGNSFCSGCGAKITQPGAAPSQNAQTGSVEPYSMPMTGQNYAPPYPPQNQAPPASAQKKSRAPLVLAIVLGAIATVVMVFCIILFAGKLAEKKYEKAAKEKAKTVETKEKTTEKKKVLEKEVKKEIENEPENEPEEVPEAENTEAEVDEILQKEDQFKAAGELSVEEMQQIAAKLSTTESANVLDPDWFIDCLLLDGSGVGAVITDESQRDVITNEMLPLAEGGWKAFMMGNPELYNSECERYLNAVIETSGDDFSITLNWKYLSMPDGQTFDESGSDVFSGQVDQDTGSVQARGSFALIEFEDFYISKDQTREYAIAKFLWKSGENDYLVLMR